MELGADLRDFGLGVADDVSFVQDTVQPGVSPQPCDISLG